MSDPVVRRVMRSVEDARNVKGMVCGMPKVTIDASDAERLCIMAGSLQSELTAARDEAERWKMISHDQETTIGDLQEDVHCFKSEADRLRARLNDFGDRLTYGVLSQGEFVGWEDAYDDAVTLADSYGGTVFSIYAQRIRKQPDEEGER